MRSLLFSVSLVICLSLTGQDYKPLVVQGNSWATVSLSWGWAWTHYYLLDGDTIINDIPYTKVYLTTDSTFQNDISYHGGIWEDTVTKEVYFYYDSFMGEILLYKFGMDIGDTALVSSMACESIYMIVTEIDTITDMMGVERRRMLMDHWYDWFDEYWIEGVGSTLGLLTAGNFACIADYNQELLCFSNSNVLHFMNPLYDTCYITEVGIAEQKREISGIKIIPNPIKGTSVIMLEGNEIIKEIKIYDARGNLVLKPSSNNPVIDKEQLDPGMFILIVITNRRNIYTSKFIVM